MFFVKSMCLFCVYVCIDFFFLFQPHNIENNTKNMYVISTEVDS